MLVRPDNWRRVRVTPAISLRISQQPDLVGLTGLGSGAFSPRRRRYEASNFARPNSTYYAYLVDQAPDRRTS